MPSCLSLKCHWHVFGTLIPFLTLPSFFLAIYNPILTHYFFFCELSPEYINFSLFPIHTLLQATILNYCSPHLIILYSIVPLQSTIHMAATLTFLKCNHNNVMLCIKPPRLTLSRIKTSMALRL